MGDWAIVTLVWEPACSAELLGPTNQSQNRNTLHKTLPCNYICQQDCKAQAAAEPHWHHVIELKDTYQPRPCATQ